MEKSGAGKKEAASTKGKPAKKVAKRAEPADSEGKDESAEKGAAASTKAPRRSKQSSEQQKEPLSPAGALAPPNTYSPEEESEPEPVERKLTNTPTKKSVNGLRKPNLTRKNAYFDSDVEETEYTYKPT